MTIEATIKWTDATEAPRFNLAVTTEELGHAELELFGPFQNLPNALTAAGFVIMEKIEPTMQGADIARRLATL